MEEVLLLCYFVGDAQTREVGTESVQIDRAELVVLFHHVLHIGIYYASIVEQTNLSRLFVDTGTDDIHAQQHLYVKQELLSRRELLGFFNRPEPKGAPVVHDRLQSGIGAGVLRAVAQIQFVINLVLFPNGQRLVFIVLGLSPHAQRIGGLFVDLTAQIHMGVPQLVNRGGQLQYAVALVVIKGLGELLIPVFDELNLIRLKRLDHLVGVCAHARIAHQEMIGLP